MRPMQFLSLFTTLASVHKMKQGKQQAEDVTVFNYYAYLL